MNESSRKVALITGGTRGIGLGIARCLAREGWTLALNGTRSEDRIREVLDQFDHGACRYYPGDVGADADRCGLVKSVLDDHGTINLLVNNAGITSIGRRDLLDAREEEFDRLMAINLKGAFFLTQLVARHQIEQRQVSASFSGCIINISSVSADMVSTNRGDYCLSKAAIGMSTRLWAVRLAEFGIPVFEVRPGVIHSDMTAGVTEKYDRLIADGLTLERRWGEAEDVGRAVAMLARGDLTYATGQVLQIDGGMSIRTL